MENITSTKVENVLRCSKIKLISLQVYKKDALWHQFLEIVNKTNLIDYTMDIRQRLDLGQIMPEVSVNVTYFFGIL